MLEDVQLPSAVPPPFLWPVKGTSRIDAVQQAKARLARRDTEERNRLLYVAMTRARDRLYVAGYEGKTKTPADCWYNLIKTGLGDALREVETPNGKVWRLTSEQTAEPTRTRSPAPSLRSKPALPDWARQKAPRDPVIAMPLVPSHLAPLEMEADEAPAPALRPPRRRPPAEPPIPSPAALAEDGRFLRGTLTHALLEHLPNLPRDSWRTAADTFLATSAAQLPQATRRDIVDETLAVLQDPALAALFGPNSRAEVAIAAEVPHPARPATLMRLTGKIDRLVESGGTVMIVDYKTNRPPPASPDKVAEAYLLQLAAYRLGVGQVFPGLPVRAAILWTHGPRIMEIAPKVLDACEQRLWTLDPVNLDA
jgi:ATP-dependent helicase/nuclease subunit A